nr:Dabb family protein [Rhodococcus qingshengii]
MYNATRVVFAADSTGSDGWADAVNTIEAMAESSGAARHLVTATLPGVINGGDLIMHLQFEDEAAWQAARGAVDAGLHHDAVEHFHCAEYVSGTEGRSRATGPNGVYRALLIRVAPHTPEGAIERFENDLLKMPGHISSIAAWRLSRVSAATGAPSACDEAPWTHVWEQEFTDLASLQTQYLDHPIHWGVVDRWFDPECTEVIVRDRICHTFGELSEEILSSDG